MIRSVDHFVLTVADIPRTVDFYVNVLGMEEMTFGDGRRALAFGTQKINLQIPGQEARNKASIGSGDFCLITDWTSEKVLAHLRRLGVMVLEGPVEKTGAKGPITSVYFNDPDGNLVEVSSYGAN